MSALKHSIPHPTLASLVAFKGTDSVSFTEIDSWSTCRQRWHWSYARNLEPRSARRAPVFGSCGHAAIAAHNRGEDFHIAIQNWLDHELEVRELFDEEVEEYKSLAIDVDCVIERYLEAYPYDFKAIYVEQEFYAPLRGHKIRLHGFWDAVVEDGRGDLWLMETKFPAQQFRPEEHIDLDAQIGIYQYAARRLKVPIVGIIYNQVLAKVPKLPKMNQNGTMSRADIRTDWPTYKAELELNGLDPAGYADMQEKLAGKDFFRRYKRFRPDQEIKNFSEDVARRIWDLRTGKRHIYMSESRITCTSCPFRELCIAKMKGADVEHLIELQFAQRRSRHEPQDTDTLEEEFTLT